MKFLFACGGTAGHINPAIAIANYIKARHPEAEILFAGHPKGMEARLIPAAGFSFAPIEILGFQRQLNWFNIKYNMRAIGCLILCWGRAKRLIQGFKPDVIIGTGGYVSGPVLREGHKLGYKTLTHESNAFPGVTTKLLAHTADKVLISVEEAKRFLPEDREYLVTGNPVREQILFANREQARQKLGIGEDKICIVSFGGSLGARRINEAIAGLMGWEQQRGGIYHIHATGSYEKDRFPSLLNAVGTEINAAGLDVREYIHDMPDCLAAADLVISRSGAMTLSELEASGTASVLIPSPNVAENHQYHNAKVLAEHDAAVVIDEKLLTPKLLQKTVEKLCADPQTLKRLGRNAQAMAIVDANERIYQEILGLLSG
ncbi:MAG: UDP-N-acetylglucosamine--N-acetylmuramyl-(pentapeptide) pyrophosphoryl-undecaprenol N-acetylglucosamine transferase [Anaerotruncus sp.]|nr:UDP-N-acetylglucosamine--N-acetylmuramyl-(pentapeptide) pyrophosphoryl-undecaprenol N-acetylglucosamine transferase [Anaerotruncus sp.]